MSLLSGMPRVPPEATRAHDVLTALGTFGVGSVFLLVGIDHIWGDAPGDLAVGWQLVLLSAGCALLLLKRRAPVTVLLTAVALAAVDTWFGQQLGILLVLIDAIYSAARFARPRAVAVLGSSVWLLVIGSAVALYLTTEDHRLALLVGLQVFAVLGTPYWWGTAVRRAEEATALAEQRAEDQHRLAAAAREAALREERSRMAGDVHDALSGHLSAIAIHAESGLVSGAEEQALRTIRGSSRLALRDLQSMVLLLRADGAHAERRTTPRLADLGALVAQTRDQGVEVAWSGSEQVGDLPAMVDLAAYRIVQESLTNAARHASGAAVEVSAVVDDGVLRVRVSNEVGTVGSAVGATAGSGVGLASMTDRARSLGGRLVAGWEGAGDARRWAVRADLPLGVGE